MADSQKSKLWHRRHKGESIHDISCVVVEDRESVSRVLRQHGGFTPPPRKRSANALTFAGREGISSALSAEHSLRQIAKAIQR